MDNATVNQTSPVITIIHASVGSGHKAAANAIAQAVESMRGKDGVPADAVVDVLDILDFGRIIFDGNKTAASFTGAGRPIYDVTWRYTLTGRLLWGGGSIWSRVMFPRFNEYVLKKRPIAVICTHITGANVAVGARMITGVEYPIICVPTDYEIEGFWPHKETDLFCVGTEFMAETLRPRKVDEARIRITGIPVRGGFDDISFHVKRPSRILGFPSINRSYSSSLERAFHSHMFDSGPLSSKRSPTFVVSKGCILHFCQVRTMNMLGISKRCSLVWA